MEQGEKVLLEKLGGHPGFPGPAFDRVVHELAAVAVLTIAGLVERDAVDRLVPRMALYRAQLSCSMGKHAVLLEPGTKKQFSA